MADDDMRSFVKKLFRRYVDLSSLTNRKVRDSYCQYQGVAHLMSPQKKKLKKIVAQEVNNYLKENAHRCSPGENKKQSGTNLKDDSIQDSREFGQQEAGATKKRQRNTSSSRRQLHGNPPKRSRLTISSDDDEEEDADDSDNGHSSENENADDSKANQSQSSINDSDLKDSQSEVGTSPSKEHDSQSELDISQSKQTDSQSELDTSLPAVKKELDVDEPVEESSQSKAATSPAQEADSQSEVEDSSDSDDDGPGRRKRRILKRSDLSEDDEVHNSLPSESESNSDLDKSILKTSPKKIKKKAATKTKKTAKSKPVKKKKQNEPQRKKPRVRNTGRYLKELEKIARHCGAYPRGKLYTQKFAGCEEKADRIEVVEQLLRDAGMEGPPTMKKAERIKLLKEAAELDQDNIIEGDVRGKRKVRSIYARGRNSQSTSDDDADIQASNKALYAGIVTDSESDENKEDENKDDENKED